MERSYFPSKRTLTQLLTEKPGRPFTRMKFKLVFRRDDRTVHELEVKNIDFQDLRRHLQSGESANIVPEFPDDSLDDEKNDRSPWYFIHV